MTTEKFNEMNELVNKMNLIKFNIDNIEKLLNSSHIFSTVSFRGDYNMVDYTFTDNEIIKNLLFSESEKLKDELTIIENEFSKM